MVLSGQELISRPANDFVFFQLQVKLLFNDNRTSEVSVLSRPKRAAIRPKCIPEIYGSIHYRFISRFA